MALLFVDALASTRWRSKQTRWQLRALRRRLAGDDDRAAARRRTAAPPAAL